MTTKNLSTPAVEAAASLKAESVYSDITVEYDGEVYTLPHPKLWPLEALEAQERGEVVGSVAAVLGPKQYKLFKSKPRVFKDIEALSELIFEAVDIELGELED